MREIKFKFYCDESCTMSRIFTLEELANGRYDFHCDINKAIKLQYTGLKDKNEVEIYEGDIIKGKHYNCNTFIEFQSGCFMEICKGGKIFFGLEQYGESWNERDLVREEIEVIGNIYENSELLKEGN